MATLILDYIGTGNGLLSDGTKPLPEPMLTYSILLSPVWYIDIHVRAISQGIHQPSITEMILKINYF